MERYKTCLMGTHGNWRREAERGVSPSEHSRTTEKARSKNPQRREEKNCIKQWKWKAAGKKREKQIRNASVSLKQKCLPAHRHSKENSGDDEQGQVSFTFSGSSKRLKWLQVCPVFVCHLRIQCDRWSGFLTDRRFRWPLHLLASCPQDALDSFVIECKSTERCRERENTCTERKRERNSIKTNNETEGERDRRL